jgi:hypothetical protein
MLVCSPMIGLDQEHSMAMGTQLSIMNLSILLAEPNLPLLARVVSTLGYAQAEALAEEALQIEDRGGMLTKDHTRRRTPGGVFFSPGQTGGLTPPALPHLSVGQTTSEATSPPWSGGYVSDERERGSRVIP